MDTDSGNHNPQGNNQHGHVVSGMRFVTNLTPVTNADASPLYDVNMNVVTNAAVETPTNGTGGASGINTMRSGNAGRIMSVRKNPSTENLSVHFDVYGNRNADQNMNLADNAEKSQKRFYVPVLLFWDN